MRKVFEGEKYVVYSISNTELSKLDLDKKFRRVGSKYFENGKEVVFISSEFFRYSGQCSGPKLVGKCGGSVALADNGYVWTNAHVAECASYLVGSMSSLVVWDTVISPRTYPLWLLRLLDYLGIDVSSKYDFAVGVVGTDPGYRPIGSRGLILTAGNCLNKADTNCLNIATEVPTVDPIEPGTEVDVLCTYWGYVAREVVMDRGTALVNYGSGYALIRPAYLLKPIDVSAVPGCSGSAVVPSGGVSVTESVRVSIERIK